MRFCINADAEFEAVDIRDALIRLSAHFIAVSLERESNLIEWGEIKVEKLEE